MTSMASIFAAAWAEVEDQMARVGSYQRPTFSSEILAAAVREVGWSNICRGPMRTMRARLRNELAKLIHASWAINGDDAHLGGADRAVPSGDRDRSTTSEAPDPRPWREPGYSRGLFDGMLARNRGIDQVIGNDANRVWRERAINAISALPVGMEFTAEDISVWCGAPPHLRVPGPVVAMAARSGLIERTGGWRRAADPKKCGHANPIWRRIDRSEVVFNAEPRLAAGESAR